MFTMSAFTEQISRTIKIVGDKGELRGHMEKDEIEIFHFSSSRSSRITLPDHYGGHGGGDRGIVRDLMIHLNDKSVRFSSNLEDAMQSHLMAFAADRSRLEGRIIQMDEMV